MLLRSLAADARNRLALLCTHTAALQHAAIVINRRLLCIHRAAREVMQSQSHHPRPLHCFLVGTE